MTIIPDLIERCLQAGLKELEFESGQDFKIIIWRRGIISGRTDGRVIVEGTLRDTGQDTDDLSREAYNGILIESEKLTHDLTLRFGLLSRDCKDETEFIEKSEMLIKAIQKLDDHELKDLFWGSPPDKVKLSTTLSKIISNIEIIGKIPINKRHYD